MMRNCLIFYLSPTSEAVAFTSKEEEIIIRPNKDKALLGDTFELKCTTKRRRRRGRQMPMYTSWSKVGGVPITSPNVRNGGNVIK